MKKLVTFLAVVVSTLFAAGCKNPVDVDFGNLLNFNERVVIAATFRNENGLSTIATLQVVWDGQTIQELTPPTPVDQLTVSGSKFGRERGSHHLSFRIAGQTSSPNTYRVTGLVITSYDEAGTVVGTLTLDPRSEILETNESIQYDFRL
jgi:hypothetical protein